MAAEPPGKPGEVFTVFLRLGSSSFGGPVAHFARVRRECMERRGWIDADGFARLLALCQLLPGPASSQLCFALGLTRAGWRGACAAFAGFTLPSALLMFGFALALPALRGPGGGAALHGLKLLALCVVAHGIVGMARALCPDIARRCMALAAALAVLVLGQAWVQLLVVALGAALGSVVCRAAIAPPEAALAPPVDRRQGWALLSIYLALLVLLPLAAQACGAPLLRYVAAFYRTGALAFGGGHVVLPLLQDAVVKPGWIAPADFLAGYGAAQAIPGPMFSMAAFLGACLPGADGNWLGACTCLAAMFLPGLLLVAGLLPLWHALSAHPIAARAIAGIGAVVVGLLAAALYDPLWIQSVRDAGDVALAAAGVALLAVLRAPVLLVGALCVSASLARVLA